MAALLLTAVGAVTALSGCGSQSAGSTAAEPEESASQVLHSEVGSTHGVTYSDGLKVRVTELGRYTPSSSAAGNNPGEVSVKATLSISNDTAAPIDVELADVAMLARGEEVSEIFDQPGGVAHLTGSVAPKKEATAVYGFSVPEESVSALTLEITPDLKHDKATFMGGV